MENLSPLPIALVGVIVLLALGSIATVIRRYSTFRAYEDLAVDARTIARALRGEVFRDGNDLVISGNKGRWPVVVRFSHAENMPGLDIRMEAPATFTVWFAPRGAVTKEGRALLRTNDPVFDARFSARSDHPTQASLLLSARHLLPEVLRLCRCATSHLAVASGAIEVTEDVIPRKEAAHYVQEQLAAMVKIAEFLKAMPGAEAHKIRPLRRERHMLGRLAIAAGVLMAVLSVVAATKSPANQKVEVSMSGVPAGVMPLEAAKIDGVGDYRLAAPEDFDQVAVAWLRGNGLQPNARVTADFSGKDTGQDVAYVLKDNDGSSRLVILVGGENRYDVRYTYLGLIARVPKGAVNSISWAGKPPRDFDGDGLLLLRRPDDLASGLVLFLSGTRVISAIPTNYQSISLQ